MTSRRSRMCLSFLLAAMALVAAADGLANGPRASVTGYAAWADRRLAGETGPVAVLPALEAKFVSLAFLQRQQSGLGDAASLRFERGLARAARAHAIDMLERGFRAHSDPAGHTVEWRTGILARTYVGTLAENLAEQRGAPLEQVRTDLGGLAASMLDGFMASPGHRRNLLDPTYTHHGVGAAAEGARVVLVHVLGQKQAELEEAPPLQVRQGETLPLAFDTASGLDRPVLYGIVPEAQAPGNTPPRALSRNQVRVAPGDHRLRFFFRTAEADTFRVIAGPIVVVR